MPWKLPITLPHAAPLLACFVQACGTNPAPRDDGIESAVFALVQSPPGQWVAAFEAVLACGVGAVGPLAAALDANSHAPGAEPAVTALGCLGDPSAEGILIRFLAHRNPGLTAEAALALARLGASHATASLRTVMIDPQRPTYVRTAAAAALLDLGDRGPAVAFACDVLLAATDRGRDRALELGLPADQVRWAVERNLAIDALARAAHGDTFGLDADASWPEIVASVERVRGHFGLAGR